MQYAKIDPFSFTTKRERVEKGKKKLFAPIIPFQKVSFAFLPHRPLNNPVRARGTRGAPFLSALFVPHFPSRTHYD